MKVMFCDVCGREMSQHEAGAISRAALADLAGAEHVCKRCADAATRIDWREAVGGLWREQVQMDDDAAYYGSFATLAKDTNVPNKEG